MNRARDRSAGPRDGLAVLEITEHVAVRRDRLGHLPVERLERARFECALAQVPVEAGPASVFGNLCQVETALRQRITVDVVFENMPVSRNRLDEDTIQLHERSRVERAER